MDIFMIMITAVVTMGIASMIAAYYFDKYQSQEP